MPWKNEVTPQPREDPSLSKVHKTKVLGAKLEEYAQDVQAILVNPPWENSFVKKK